jgi:hypothetical protein
MYLCLYGCMYACQYVSMSVCVYVCRYVHVCILTHTQCSPWLKKVHDYAMDWQIQFGNVILWGITQTRKSWFPSSIVAVYVCTFRPRYLWDGKHPSAIRETGTVAVSTGETHSHVGRFTGEVVRRKMPTNRAFHPLCRWPSHFFTQRLKVTHHSCHYEDISNAVGLLPHHSC